MLSNHIFNIGGAISCKEDNFMHTQKQAGPAKISTLVGATCGRP